MKKKCIAIGTLFMMLLCSSFIVAATPSGPVVRLPTQFVTMRAIDGSQSWFQMTLSNISVGFDVINSQYLGWCVQKDTDMTRGVNHRVLLYSSYDPAMPPSFLNANWDKINYLINHKNGSRQSIQNVIWYYICGDSIPIDDTHALAMRADADAFGNGFVPQPGQRIAILVDVINSVYSIQRTFFELRLPSKVPLGDLVWHDYNANGIQDAGEPGIPGIRVSLHKPNGTEVDSFLTDIHGYYSFGIFSPGEYYIQFTLPSGYLFSPMNQGNNDAKDSDANPSTGRTPLIVCNPLASDTSWDAGMYVPINPQNPGAPAPPPVFNQPPTADGTAGEPYAGFIGEEIYFDGSRSYDRDGMIVSSYWNFGDGTIMNGTIVTHIYEYAGTYLVSFTVTDDSGAKDTYSTVAHIKQPNLPPHPPVIVGPEQGNQNLSHGFTVTAIDPDNDHVRYLILWGDGSQNTSLFMKNGLSYQTSYQWDTWGFYTIQAFAQDFSNATSDVSEFRVAIGVQYVGSLGYLINTDGVGPFDMFFSNQTGNMTVVKLLNNGEYLIDSDNDGIYNFLYNPLSGSLQSYPFEPDFTVPMLFIGMIMMIFLVVLFAFKRKRKNGRSQK